MSPLKHIPLRRCAACGASSAKRGLLRLVRLGDGRVAVDPKGKTPGRGTYLCYKPECWDTATKKERLDHALRVTLTPAQRLGLLEEFRTLAKAAMSVGASV